MTNADIAETFEHIADLLEYQGGNVFRVRAYRNAARTIGDMVESLAAVRADPKRSLTDLEGIGADLADKIGSLLDAGELPLLAELRKSVPPVVFELMRIPGLGPKKVKLLVDALGIDSLDSLETACQEGRVADVKGFAAKTQAAILGNIGFAKSPDHARLLWEEADLIIQNVLAWMRECPQVRQIEGAGSWRRGRETVGDLDVVVDKRRRHRRHGSIVRLEGDIDGSAARRYQDQRARSARRSDRSAGRRPWLLWGGPAVFHRFEGAQRTATIPGEGAWADNQRIRCV